MAPVSGTITITNSSAHDLTLRIEPWDERAELRAGASLVLSWRAPSPGGVEIEWGAHEVVVYGWEGSVIEINPPPSS